MPEQTSQSADRAPGAANPGLARPPAIYLIAIVVGLALQSAWPISFAPRPAMPVGLLIVILAAALFVWSTRTFRSAHTPVAGNQPTTAVASAGPYRFSRNPIYLAFTVCQLGAAFCLNSVWLLVTLLPAIALMSFVVIPREERYLGLRFGEEYSRYRASVRRWL